MSDEDQLSFLRSVELFADFTEQELRSLVPFFHEAVFEEGDWIIREGDTGQPYLFVLKSGKAEIVKEEKEHSHVQLLGYLEKGDWVGEMAHFENDQRSASVRALEKVNAASLPLDQLYLSPGTRSIYSKIVIRLARKMSQRLRKTGEALIDTMKEKLQIIQSHNQISKTIIHVFIMMALWFNVFKLTALIPSHQRAFLDPILSAFLFILFGISTAYVIKISGYPLSFYGLTLRGWPRICFDAILYTIPLLIFITFFKWLLISNLEMFKGVPLFSVNPTNLSARQSLLVGVVYILFIPVQELVARGGLQSCLRNFFQGPDRALMAILTSNILFEMVHTVKNLWFAMATFFLGIFWGILFEQQKSLVGVCVSHAIIGIWAFGVLDVQTLIDISNML